MTDAVKGHIDHSQVRGLRPVRTGSALTAPFRNSKRPCEQGCKIRRHRHESEIRAAEINNDKCISCGACVYQCPFGAIMDKSFILDAIQILIRKSDNNQKYKVYAVVAPSISSQFTYAKLGPGDHRDQEAGLLRTWWRQLWVPI